MIVVASIEGVLSDGPLPLASASITGVQLYRGLGRAASWVLLSSTAPRLVAEAWLIREGFPSGWISLKAFDESLCTSEVAWKQEVAEQLLASGTRPALWLDTDVDAALAVSATGIPTHLSVTPEPDVHRAIEPGKYRPWEEVAATVADRRMRKAVLQARTWNQEVGD